MAWNKPGDGVCHRGDLQPPVPSPRVTPGSGSTGGNPCLCPFPAPPHESSRGLGSALGGHCPPPLLPACISDQSSPTPDSTRKVRLWRDRRSCSRAGDGAESPASGWGAPGPGAPPGPPVAAGERCWGCTGSTGCSRGDNQDGPSSTVEELVQPSRCSARDPAGSHGIPPWAQRCPRAMPPLPLPSQPGWGFLCSPRPGAGDSRATRKGWELFGEGGVIPAYFWHAATDTACHDGHGTPPSSASAPGCGSNPSVNPDAPPAPRPSARRGLRTPAGPSAGARSRLGKPALPQ